MRERERKRERERVFRHEHELNFVKEVFKNESTNTRIHTNIYIYICHNPHDALLARISLTLSLSLSLATRLYRPLNSFLGRCPYSCFLVRCCLQELFITARSILV